jgi:hypothetical protein
MYISLKENTFYSILFYSPDVRDAPPLEEREEGEHEGEGHHGLIEHHHLQQAP